MWYVSEAQWLGEQEVPQPKHQSNMVAALDDTKLAHTQRVDGWCKQVIHSIMTTHSLNGQENDGDEEDDIEKREGQLWKKHDGLVCVACRKAWCCW